VRDTAKASSERPTSMTFIRLRMRFGIAAALFALLALAFAAFSSADPLGEITLYKEGLREPAFVKQLTPGPDGNVWFVDNKAFSENSAIGRITPSGEIKEFNQPGERDLVAIVAGPKGEKYLWFTDKGTTPSIGKVDSANPETTEEFSIQAKGGNAGSVPQGIVVGPDDNLWFTDSGATPAIGMIDPGTLVVKECSAGLNAGSEPHGIVAGADGNLWFTDSGTTKAIGRINPGTCEIKEFATGANSEPGGSSGLAGPWGIAAGPDGNVWFTEGGNNKTNSPTGKAIGRITPSGEITYFYEGLSPSSKPFGLTAAKGKLWFADNSSVNEQQEVEIKAEASLGGIYNLCFEEKCTGWKGEATLTGESGEGEMSGWEGTGDVTTTSKEVKNVKVNQGKVVVGQEFGCATPTCGIAATAKVAECKPSCEAPETIILSEAAKGAGSGTGKTLKAGSKVVANVKTTAGTFTVGHTMEGTGIHGAGVTISAVEEGGKKLVMSRVAVNTGTFALTAGTKSVTGASGSGTLVNGEAITGTGIQSGTTISSVNQEAGTFTLSKVASNTGKFSLSTGFSPGIGESGNSAIRNALEGLSTIGKDKFELSNIGVNGAGIVSPVKRIITFESDFGAKDVSQLTCDASGLTGTSPSCAVTTIATGKPNAIGSITTSGEIARYEKEELLWGVDAITTGPDGNLWCSSGLTVIQSICKFGIEVEEGPTNRRTLTVTKSPAGNAGAGLGTVSSKPKGIKCAQSCNEAVGRFYMEQAVELKAAPSGELSSFDKWVGCPTPEGLVCKVPAGKADVSVEAVFKGSSKAFSPAEALTLSKGESEDNFGWGTVKASGLTCEAECDETTVLYQGPITEPKAKPGKVVILKQAPAFGSKFIGWTGCNEISETECEVKMESAKEVVAEYEALPNKALTVEKKYEGGLGSVSSKPKGINCGATCTATSANMPEGSSIVLTAKPATTTPATTFVKWEGGDCAGKTELTCTVGMDKAETVKAVFSGPVKTIVEPKSLTLTKEGEGFGTIKASGLTCEVLCTGATSLYYGPVTLPKPKAGAKVILKATPAPGSTAVTWSGCTPLNATECEVVMNTNASVGAKFDELE